MKILNFEKNGPGGMTNQAYQHTKTDQHTHTDRHTTDNKHWIGLGLNPNLINIK